MNEYGIKDTLEVLKASQSLAVLVYRAQKGGGSAQEIAMRIATSLTMNPYAFADLKAAADGIGNVVLEAKDLTFSEALELVAECGKLAAAAAKEIQTP